MIETAVVTGAASGIGLGIAQGLAAQGVNIVINGFGDKDAIEKERWNFANFRTSMGVRPNLVPVQRGIPTLPQPAKDQSRRAGNSQHSPASKEDERHDPASQR